MEIDISMLSKRNPSDRFLISIDSLCMWLESFTKRSVIKWTSNFHMVIFKNIMFYVNDRPSKIHMKIRSYSYGYIHFSTQKCNYISGCHCNNPFVGFYVTEKYWKELNLISCFYETISDSLYPSCFYLSD